MTKEKAVIFVTAYMMMFLIGLSYLIYLVTSTSMFLSNYKIILSCMISGGIGGCVYCLRGIYLNFCVRKQWTNDWSVWYFIRPWVSLICGGVSYIFLKAGLLVLEAKNLTNASSLGFYAFSFIAGLNVDKFINKIEDFAQATWGIEKSRVSKSDKAD